MSSKENGAPAVATQGHPDRTKLNAAKSIEPSTASQARNRDFRVASLHIAGAIASANKLAAATEANDRGATEFDDMVPF